MELSKIYRGCKKGGRPSMAKQWFISYTRDGKRRKEYYDINKGTTVKEREELARGYKDALDKELIAHHLNPGPKSVNSRTLHEAFEWGIEKKKPRWKKKSAQDFAGVFRLFYLVAGEMNILNKDVKLVKRSTMREVLERMRKKRGCGDHMYLKYKRAIHNIFGVLKDWEHIDFNPCDWTSEVKKPKPKEKLLLKPDQQPEVKKHILEHYPAFWPYLMVVNMTSIRPKEVFNIRVGSVDLAQQTILLRAADTKDDEDRLVIIPDVLVPYLADMSLGDYPEHFFVFGNGFLPQERKEPVHRNRATELWKTLIKDPKEKGGLGIQSNMYWLKDLGINASIDQDIELEAIQQQAGHSSIEMTMKYVQKHRPKTLKAVKEKTPDPWK